VVHEEQTNSQQKVIPLFQGPRLGKEPTQINQTTIHKNLKASDGARFYNSGTKKKNRRLKPRLPQDLLSDDIPQTKNEIN